MIIYTFKIELMQIPYGLHNLVTLGLGHMKWTNFWSITLKFQKTCHHGPVYMYVIVCICN